MSPKKLCKAKNTIKYSSEMLSSVKTETLSASTQSSVTKTLIIVQCNSHDMKCMTGFSPLAIINRLMPVSFSRITERLKCVRKGITISKK